MRKIDFYMLPSTGYRQITSEDAVLFEKNIATIGKNDSVYVPNEFYEKKDVDGITAVDFLYGEQNDISMFLLETIRVLSSSERTYDDIDGMDGIGYVAFACDEIDDRQQAICVYRSSRDVVKVKRFYAILVNTYEEYIDCMEDAFPNLVFCENAFDKINKLGEFSDVKDELHRHLAILCDYAKEIYFQAGKREEDAFAEIKAKHNIYCSGKGSNETKDFKVDFRGIKITCNPHTKLFSSYSDQRIYFCWGRDEIENHNVIVARIGNHWEK